jgi:16S rRNA (guanine527-N7)-methyltransferase
MLPELQALAATHDLPDRWTRQMGAILDELVEEEASVSSVRAPAEAVRVHIADSLDGLRVGELRQANRVADIGAGAGFPGLVLASALPDAHVSLIESVGRKCAFMDRAAASASLDNVEVVQGRAETWSEGAGTCDVVTARAVAPLTALVEYAAPLLAMGGVLVAWKGKPEPGEEADGMAAAAATGMQLDRIDRIEPREGADQRRLYVYLKVMDTPEKFPRRAGMARKRPITAST